MNLENPDNLPGNTQPPVVFWFKVYAGIMTAIYAVCMLAGPILIWIGTQAKEEEREEFFLEGTWLFIVGLPLAIANALPFSLPRRRWVWIYDLVLICLGLTSCCFLPATVPLLIYWINPKTKTWFNRV